MNSFLNGKKIVVMGVINKKSIAWGCASALKNFGAKVIFTYQNERAGQSLEKLLDKDDTLIQCDVSKEEEIITCFEEIKNKFGNIDGLVHSIAFAKREDLEGDFTKTSKDGFLLAHDISAFSFISVCNHASTIMNDGGSFVTLTYIGSTKAIPNYNVMGVAKSALESSVRYLAYELAKRDIRVNAISAGVIKTLALSGVKDSSKLMEIAIDRTPSNKSVTIEEVGNTASFLLSELSSGITGEVIYVDKGFHLS